MSGSSSNSGNSGNSGGGATGAAKPPSGPSGLYSSGPRSLPGNLRATPGGGGSGAPRPVSMPGLVSSGGSASGKPLKGWALVSRWLALAANLLVRLSRLGFSEAKERSGKALNQFAARPEHTRQRVYAFGSYGAIILLTFAAQLYEPNSLQAYVKVEPVALPEATVIFVRNDSTRIWKDVKVTLNGRYGYQRLDLPPTRYISLPVDRFAFYDQNGKATYAAKEIVPRTIAVDCDRGHFELDLEQK